MDGYVKEMRRKIGTDMLMFAGAGIFLYQDGKVLLQRRRDNGCWSDHGGCIEIGETAEEAARRELFEETGLVAGKLSLLGVFTGKEMLYTYPNGDQAYIIGISYICEDFSGELLAETNETAELRWFDVNRLPEEISPPVRKPMAAFAKWAQKRHDGS